jgi:hypothetical protein
MGAYDGAETCEIVGLYMLNQLQKHIPAEQVGLYRDDGLAIIQKANGPKLDRIRKKIIETFKKEGLKITIEIDLTEVDFLDVKMNLASGKFFPYRKPNDQPLYINTQSNHPPTIIKQIPEMIGRRISDLSCNKEEFEKAKGMYEAALKNSGYKGKLEYKENTERTKKRQRSRKIIWYNPPYSTNVTTNIGRKFFQLIEKHFPAGSKLSKIFNRNTIKLSYSCLPNMGSVLKSTRQVPSPCQSATQEKEAEKKMCNCRKPGECPLDGKCLQSGVVYEASINAEDIQYKYIGLTESTFKTRYNAHNSSIKHDKWRTSTELSKKVWELKDNGTKYDIKWKIIQHAHPYSGGGKYCDLCLTEKLYILMCDSKYILNKRRELISKCRHVNKFRLKKCVIDASV